jgi:hypothetical protein
LGFNAQKQAQKEMAGIITRRKEAASIHGSLAFVIDSVAQGKTLYTEAFRLTDTNRTTFSKLVEGLHA